MKGPGGKKKTDKLDYTSAQVSATLINKAANASNEAYFGMDLLRSEGERLINNVVDIKQGNFFEIIERTKFNVDAASKGMGERAVTTAEMGLWKDPVDIKIKAGSKVLREVQAKSSREATSALFEMSNEKYEGMQKLFNSDKVDKARELAEKRVKTGALKASDYSDTLKNMTGELKYGEIHSGGTTYDEAMKAAEDYKNYAKGFEIDQFSKELGKSIVTTSAVSSLIGGGVSILKNSIAYGKDEIGADDLLGNVILDTGKSAIRGGMTGGVSTTIRTVAQKSGNQALAKTNVATSIASGAIDMGITVVSYIRGEIDSEQAIVQIGEKGFNTMSSVYGGMAAGAVFGPGGALVGSLVGYMIASNVYLTCVETFEYSRLREEEALRLIVLYDEAISTMKAERENFERYISQRLVKNEHQFKKLLYDVEGTIKKRDIGTTIIGMSELAYYFGKELKYVEFKDFDDAMKSENPLIL